MTDSQGGAPRRGLISTLLKGVAEDSFPKCGSEGCTKLSLGAMCRGCGKVVCVEHGYLTMSVPPAVLCGECVCASVAVEREMRDDGKAKHQARRR